MRESSDLSIRARLFRGYGPMVCLLVTIAVVSMVVPSRVATVDTTAANSGFIDPTGGQVALDGSGSPDAAGAAEVAGDTTTVVGATVPGGGTASGGAGTGGSSATVKGTTTVRPGSPSAPAPGPNRGVVAKPTCAGGLRLVATDYSPVCTGWVPGADNGGATSNGVTDKDIVVSVRTNAFVNALLDLLADAANSSEFKEPESKTNETLVALVEYFNKSHHFFGRKIRLAPFQGVGKSQEELFGGGAGGAQADAVNVAQQLKAFADLSATTLPYAEALRRQGVVNIGAPYPSKQWLNDNKPYSWTAGADCTTIANAASTYYLNRLAGRPAAFAGGDLSTRQRSVFVLAPENASYRQCADAAIQTINDAGRGSDIAKRVNYKLDFDTMRQTAVSIAPQIVASGATTVFCACDPVMMLFLTAQLDQQNWQPEWISTGVAYVDQDLVGQLMPTSQWKRAFGISFAGPTEGIEGGEAWQAYKSVRPNGRPSIAVEIMYYQLQMLAIGLQGAGPNLTPENFARGMYSFPKSSGRSGTWAFGPDDYATADDAREIYWKPDAASSQNQRRGAWLDTAPGTRYPIGTWPSGDPAIPNPGP